MKVLLYGNQDNIGFRLGRWLRQKGIDVTLFIPSYTFHDRSKLEWEDPNLADARPDWIREFGQYYPDLLHKVHRRLFRVGWGALSPGRALIKTSRNYDVVITSGYFVIGAAQMGKPVVFVPTGGDIKTAPFATNGVRSELAAYLFRKGIKNVSRILTAQEHCLWAAKLLKVSDRIIRYHPWLVDVNEMSANVDQVFLAELKERYHNFDWIFFHPSRKMMDPNHAEYKGNEKFLQAFSQVIRANPALNVKLVIGMHGHHVTEFRQLIEQLGVMNYCDLIEHLPLPELHAYMSLKNLVLFDEFGSSVTQNLGGLQRETLSFGALLVAATYINSPEFIEAHGPECPLFPAFEVADLAEVMEKIISLSPAEHETIRQASKVWAYRYLHWENRIDELIAILEDVIREARTGS